MGRLYPGLAGAWAKGSKTAPPIQRLSSIQDSNGELKANAAEHGVLRDRRPGCTPTKPAPPTPVHKQLPRGPQDPKSQVSICCHAQSCNKLA